MDETKLPWHKFRDAIAERIRGGMRNAKAKGRRLGRKLVTINIAAIQRLRSEGKSFAKVSQLTGYSVATIFRSVKQAGAHRSRLFQQAVCFKEEVW